MARRRKENPAEDQMHTCQTTEVGPVGVLVRGMTIHFLGELPLTLEKLSCPTKDIL